MQHGVRIKRSRLYPNSEIIEQVRFMLEDSFSEAVSRGGLLGSGTFRTWRIVSGGAKIAISSHCSCRPTAAGSRSPQGMIAQPLRYSVQ